MEAGSKHGHGGHPGTGAWAKENMTKASDWRWTILPESLHTTNIVKNWLVASTPLKNISQLGLFFPIYGKIKNVPNHQPGEIIPSKVVLIYHSSSRNFRKYHGKL